MKIDIRLANAETDRKFVESLNARLTAGIDAPAHDAEAVNRFQRRFTETAWGDGGGASFIAQSESGQPLGYVNVRPGNDDIADEPCAYVALLAVVEDAEGKGIARALMDEATNWAVKQGYTRITLDVFASNRTAQDFYSKAGFAPETLRLVRKL